MADACMTTRHQNSVLLFVKAYLAELSIFVFLLKLWLSLFNFNVLLHPVDSFTFEGHTVDNSNLLIYPDSFKVLFRVFLEHTVIDVTVLLTITWIRIVNAHNQRVIFFLNMFKIVSTQFVHIKTYLIGDNLVLSRPELNLLDIVCLVGTIEHGRNILGILLLGNTGVDSHSSRNSSI